MRLFITGATGQVGGALTKAAVAAGHSVICLVRDPVRARALLGAEVEFVQGDLPLLGDWVGALGGCDRVVHAAGVVSYVGAKAGLMRAVNVEGTRVLLAAARAAGVRRFVFTSSIAALGEVPVGEVGDEETPWDWGRVGSAYLETKRDAHALVLGAGGIETVVLCPGIIFGAGDVNENGLRLIRQVWAGAPGVPLGWTTAANLSDVVAAHLLALEGGVPGQAYVIGSFRGSFRELIGAIGGVLGRTVPRWDLPYGVLWALGGVQEGLSWLRGGEPPLTRALALLSSVNRAYRSDKAQLGLGFVPTPIELGIAEAFAWARGVGRL